MLSGWDIYWIMQLDQIRNAAIGCSIIFTILSIISIIATLVIIGALMDGDDLAKVLKKPIIISSSIVICICIFANICATFIPTTKTAAAIVILPKILNNEALQEDAGEIYNLAVERAKEVLATKKAKND